MKKYIIIKSYEVPLKLNGITFSRIQTAPPSVFGCYDSREKAEKDLQTLNELAERGKYYIAEVIGAE